MNNFYLLTLEEDYKPACTLALLSDFQLAEAVKMEMEKARARFRIKYDLWLEDTTGKVPCPLEGEIDHWVYSAGQLVLTPITVNKSLYTGLDNIIHGEASKFHGVLST